MKRVKRHCCAGAGFLPAPAILFFALPAAVCLSLLSGCVVMPDEARQMVTDIHEAKMGVRDLKLRMDDEHKDLRTRQLSQVEQDRSQFAQTRDRMIDIERRLERIEASLNTIETALIEMRGAAGTRTTPGGVAMASARSMSVTSGGVVLNAKEFLRTAYELTEKGRYEEAIPVFQNVAKVFPASDLADDALFGVGDCLENLKQYAPAIESYLKVPAQYPDGDKAPVAYYRSALCASSLSDKKRAVSLLEELIVKYPAYEGMPRVKETLREIQSK